jgi:hypothetical protein
MASKKQIAEQAMRIISGGHLKPDRTVDIREVMIHLDQIRDARVRIDTFNNVKMGEYVVDEDYLTFHESVSVQTDAVKSLKYVVLPANPISLPYGLGLYQITPIGDMEDAWIIVPTGQIALAEGSQALEHELKTYCWRVGDRVYFKNIDAAVSEVTLLTADTSADIAETADYPVPPDVEAELLQQLVQTFGVMQQVPHDEQEDGQK